MADDPEWLIMQRDLERRRINFCIASSAMAGLTPALFLPVAALIEVGLLDTPITSILYATFTVSLWILGDRWADAGSTLRYLMRLLAIICAFMALVGLIFLA
jgi:hypothetical protein